MSKCETIGCQNTATHALTWRYVDGPITDKVCAECAESYVRRPALGATVEPLS